MNFDIAHNEIYGGRSHSCSFMCIYKESEAYKETIARLLLYVYIILGRLPLAPLYILCMTMLGVLLYAAAADTRHK
jgi:hypothetical protein